MVGSVIGRVHYTKVSDVAIESPNCVVEHAFSCVYSRSVDVADANMCILYRHCARKMRCFDLPINTRNIACHMQYACMLYTVRH